MEMGLIRVLTIDYLFFHDELLSLFCRSYTESSQMCTVSFGTLGNETAE